MVSTACWRLIEVVRVEIRSRFEACRRLDISGEETEIECEGSVGEKAIWGPEVLSVLALVLFGGLEHRGDD